MVVGACEESSLMPEHQHRRASLPERPPEVRTVELIEVKFRRGEGCCEEDLVREVTAYYWADGDLLTEIDPCVK